MSAQYPTIMPSEPKGVTWGLNKLLHCVFERICPFVIQNVTKVETEFVIVLGSLCILQFIHVLYY